MELVEFYRVRRTFAWYAGILTAIVVLVYAFGRQVDIQIDGMHEMPKIGLSVIAAVAMFFSAGFATAIGTALNRENATLELTWTRPTSRSTVAWGYIAVDLLALAAAYLTAALAIDLILIRVGVPTPYTPQTPGAIILAFGVSAMWYALTLALTARVRERAGTLAGVLWPVAIVLLVLGMELKDGLLRMFAVALDVFNPFSYLNSVTVSDHGATGAATTVVYHSLFALPVEWRALVVWGLTALYCYLAVTLWRRREV